MGNGIGGACGSRQTAPTARKRGPGGKATVELDLTSIRQGEGVCTRKGGRVSDREDPIQLWSEHGWRLF